jgi:UDP-N-acetylglucosamine/UDP-N-acetylgalactosamine 4-epimerase
LKHGRQGNAEALILHAVGITIALQGGEPFSARRESRAVVVRNVEEVVSRYESVRAELRAKPGRWLVTGAAGFIGSNITKALLELGQDVVGLDNFSTGYQRNVDQAIAESAGNGTFRMIRGDIEDFSACQDACRGVDYVVHQAAIGSVPRSMEDPIAVNRTNVDGFVNMLTAARDAGAKRFVYASSCAMYGDAPGTPKHETDELRALSPYAVTKHVNELYAAVYQRAFGINTVGLRYFNVFGPRQDPDGAYAAVIPSWMRNLLLDEPCRIYGDGATTRDFVYVDDVVQANILASVVDEGDATGTAYNIGSAQPTSLTELFALIRDSLADKRPELAAREPLFEPFRSGDIRHSRAEIAKASAQLGFAPRYTVRTGLQSAVEWYAENLVPAKTAVTA